MNINKITAPIQNFARKTCQNLGAKVTKSFSADTADKFVKLNKFTETDGVAMAQASFITLVGTCVIIPRLLKARDNDERREILTRDITTVATMLLAMKALRGSFSDTVGKMTGMVLTKNAGNPDAKGIKKLGQYLNPMGGISSLDEKEIKTIYSQFKDKESIIKFLKNLDEKGGNSDKVMARILNSGEQDIIGKIFGIKKIEGMEETAKKLFGENLEIKDVIETIEKADDETIKPILDVLNNDNNPLVKMAKGTNAWLQAVSLGIIIGFTGFGLPAINKALTDKRHAKEETGMRQNPTLSPEVGVMPKIKITQAEQAAFQKFL